MAVVWIPPLLRDLTNGAETVRVGGSSVRQLLDELDTVYPGLKARLCTDEALRPGIAVIVDGATASLGLLQPVRPESEVHFLPAIGGGSERLIATEPFRGVQTMNTTWYEQGIEKRIEKGREEARHAVLREQVEEKFGPLSAQVKQRLADLPADRLIALTKPVELESLGYGSGPHDLQICLEGQVGLVHRFRDDPAHSRQNCRY